jgi:hypothetical protein
MDKNQLDKIKARLGSIPGEIRNQRQSLRKLLDEDIPRLLEEIERYENASSEAEKRD